MANESKLDGLNSDGTFQPIDLHARFIRQNLENPRASITLSGDNLEAFFADINNSGLNRSEPPEDPGRHGALPLLQGQFRRIAEKNGGLKVADIAPVVNGNIGDNPEQVTAFLERKFLEYASADKVRVAERPTGSRQQG